jgi:cytoskeletal protein CcmA (bactofilin family)
VKGEIVQTRIAIEDGAFFDGTCRHAENPLADAPKA